MANLKVSEQAYPSTRYTEGAAPATPATGEVITYAKADGLMYQKDDAGTETQMGPGAAGAPSTADYLVGTSNGSLSAEIVVGTSPGGELGGSWGTPTVDALHSGSYHAIGRLPIVSSPWQLYSDAPSNAESLASSGGTLIVPIYVPAPFNYTTLHIWSTDTASARAAEHRLYYYGGSTMDFVTGTDGTFSYTPGGAASNRTSAVSGAPVALKPGGYILAIRNTSGAQTFGIGYVSTNASYFNNQTMHATQTLGSALGSTLTTSSWSAGARIHAVRLIAADIFGA